MRRINACVAMVGLAAVILIFPTPPSPAFNLRVGPYHFSFPTFWHRYRHHKQHMRAAPTSHMPPESEQGKASALFYPQLALPLIYASVFSPSYSSSWPFDYPMILSTAFAKVQLQLNPHSCQPRPDLSTKIIAPIRTALAPTDAQTPLLERLGDALGAAADSLEKSCVIEIPGQPIPRLQLMGSQIKELAMTIDTVRNPLQDFVRSLNDEQRARFAAMIAAPTGMDRGNWSENIASHCSATFSTADRLIAQIDKSVQPIGLQRDALADLKQAIEGGVRDLTALCLTPLPPTAFSRLETIEARLDATWRAVSSIQVALANFEVRLSDEQKERLNAINLVAAGNS